MRHPLALMLVLLAGAVSGCASKIPVEPLSVATVTSARAGSISPAVIAVQSHPLYKQAETAVATKDKVRALVLLKQLSETSTLEPDGHAFCLRQISLLTNSKVTVAVKPVSIVANTSAHVQTADCGPRALALALQSFGKSVPASTLSEWANTDAKGTTMAGLKTAAKKAGITAEGLQVSREAVEEITVPALAWKNQNHYVAILETSGRGENWQATVHDPNEQNPRTLQREEFLQMCGGYVLTLKR